MNCPEPQKISSGMQLARLDGIAGAIDANLLGREADPHQWCCAENVIGQLVGKGSVLRINNVGIDGNNFRLHGEAAAVIIDRLIVADGGDKIGVIPLSMIKARPSLHGRRLAGLQSRERPPAVLSKLLSDGGEREWHH